MIDNNVTLENAPEEFELMEFTIGENVFGIEVSKVTEIIMAASAKPMPHSHPAGEGVYKPRESVLTVIDLPLYLKINKEEDRSDRDLFIVTSFKELNLAFRVNSVLSIDRVARHNVQKPDPTIYGSEEGFAVGLVEFEGRLITILDFEKIVDNISADSYLEPSINLGE